MISPPRPRRPERASGGTPDPRVSRPHVQRYVAAWLFAGVAVAGAVVLATDLAAGAPTTPAGWGRVLGFVAIVAASYLGRVAIPVGRSLESVNLIEAALVGVLVVFPASWAFVVTVAGIALANAVSRTSAVKRGFNLATASVAAAGAVWIRDVVAGASGPLTTRGLAGVTLAVVFFGAVSFLAVSGVLARIEDKDTSDMLRRGRHVVPSIIGNTAIGITGAVVWQHRPELLFLLVVPLAATTLAYRGRATTSTLVEQLRRERDQLDQIIRGASDGICLVDEAGRVVVWNDSLARLTGVAEGAAVGAPLRTVLPLVDAADHRPLDPVGVVASAAPGNPAVEVDAGLVDPETGDERAVRLTATAVATGEGGIGGVLLVRDTSRERDVERIKDDFLMRVSHELRTPLTPIKGYAESLRVHRDRVTPELLDASLARISERSDHMAALIDDLLLVATMQRTGRLADEPILAAVDPVAAARDAVSTLTQRHDAHPVTVVGDSAAACVADPGRLQRVLGILLDNAVTYSPVGSSVEVVVREAGRRVAIDVVDHGRGIPRSHLERVFDRFHRVEDPLLMTTGGLGIGLHLARHLARSMAGDVTVESVLGQGSTFTVTLARAGAAGRPAPSSLDRHHG